MCKIWYYEKRFVPDIACDIEPENLVKRDSIFLIILWGSVRILKLKNIHFCKIFIIEVVKN